MLNTGAQYGRWLHLSRSEYWCYVQVMPIAPTPLTLAPNLPFKYVGGDPSLDLINTVDWTPRGPAEERLTDYERLTRWAEGVGLVSAREGSRLRARALEHPRAALSAALGQLELVSRAAGDSGAGALRWGWRDAGERMDSVLWPVLRAAGDLLASDESTRIRECGGDDCGWMYVDRSRNGLRRWCQMETCGTKEKSRQRALRRAEAG